MYMYMCVYIYIYMYIYVYIYIYTYYIAPALAKRKDPVDGVLPVRGAARPAALR